MDESTSPPVDETEDIPFFDRPEIKDGAMKVLDVMKKYRGKFKVGMTADKQLDPQWIVNALMNCHSDNLSLEYDNHVLRATLQALMMSFPLDSQKVLAETTGLLLEHRAGSMENQIIDAQEKAKSSIIVPNEGEGLAISK